MSQIVFIVVIIAALITLAVYSYIRQLKSAWTGTLIDKQVVFTKSSESESGIKKNILIFKTDEGKLVRFNVDDSTYNNFIVGTKCEKKSGEYLPIKTV